MYMNSMDETIRLKSELLIEKAKNYDLEKKVNQFKKLKRGHIIIGYPGVGKTTISNRINNCVDLDSSPFSKCCDNWYEAYCHAAIAIATAGNIVFISSHSAVYTYLEKQIDSITKNNVDVIVCYPKLELKSKWISKLYNRYCISKEDKDARALSRALTNYNSDISALADLKFNQLVICDMKYDLVQLLELYHVWECIG